MARSARRIGSPRGRRTSLPGLSATLAALIGCNQGPASAPTGMAATPPDSSSTAPRDANPAPRDANPAPRDANSAPRDANPAPRDAGVALTPIEAPGFGPGFTDLTEGIELAPPFVLDPPSERTGGDPEFTAGVFGRTGEVIFVRRSAGFEPLAAQRRRYDRATRRLVDAAPFSTTLNYRDLGVALALDLDQDGRLDYLTSHPHRELLWGPEPTMTASEALTPAASDRFEPFWSALNVDDFDDDGWLDVITARSACCANCRELGVYLRTGLRRFADRTDLVDDAPACAGIAVMGGAVGGERALLAIGTPCGNQDAPGFYRRGARDASGYPHFSRFDPLPADAYFRLMSPDFKRMRAITMWSPMGAAIGDLDGDGRSDFGIALNFYVARFAGREALPLGDVTTANGAPELLADSGRPMIPWGMAYVDLDQDGRVDQVVAHGNDHVATVDPSATIGPQFVTASWNGGRHRFADVSAALHLDRRGQWRSLAVGDLDEDGDADLIVGGLGEMPRVYRNDIASGNHGFSLRLRGTSSNALGVGAVVEVRARAGGPTQRFVAGGVASPLAASEPLVFVGLGAATSAAAVRITWPTGTVQVLRDVASGALHEVREPPLFALDPPSRHARLGAPVTIRVTPRDESGGVRRDARVSVAVTAGGARVEGPATWDGTAYVARLASPPAPGSSLIELRVDDVASPIHPRVWWEGGATP